MVSAQGRSLSAWIGALAVLFGLFLLPTTAGLPHVVRSAAIWTLLMALPGAALFRLLGDDRHTFLERSLAGLVASPVLLTLVAATTLLSGRSAHVAATAVTTVAATLVFFSALVKRHPTARPGHREALLLLTFIVALLLLTATLPFTREWWRIRSDAWFHAAVVAQIRDFGLPPEDPYFVGLPLQYMWFYHVLVLTLSQALRLDAFWVMAIVNAHAVVALVVAAYQLAGTLRPGVWRRFAATATLVLAFNAAFWILLPVKFVKAFMGDVRGMEEVARTFALTPLHYNTAYGFMNIYFNQEFFLDKFMVATAFGIALVFMVSAWAGAVDYLQRQRRYGLVLMAASIIGMLGFHSLVGFVFLVGAVGGAILLHLVRARVDGYRARAAMTLVAVSVLCFLAMTPYLYLVMHGKERAQVIPIDFSFKKIAGILISSAFVIAVSLRARSFWTDRSVGARFFALGALVVTAFCFSISLPGPNTYDKLGYFVFIPFSIVAGFAIADSVAKKQGRVRATTAAAWVLLFFVPVNAIALVSCFGTPDAVEVSPAESRLSEWVRANTPRDAVFIDDHERVPLLVTGPRRYFWGTQAYADQWGYPKTEMSRRRRAIEVIYGPWPRDEAAYKEFSEAFETLASVNEPLFVVLRPEHQATAAVITRTQFEIVFEDSEISLLRVDPVTCTRLAARIYN